MTYSDWFTTYMKLYKGSLKPRTSEEYRRIHGKYLQPAFGGKELDAITPEDVQSALVLSAAIGGTRQAQAVFSLVHAVMRRACRSRLIAWSPVDALDKPEHNVTPGKQLTDADRAAALPFIHSDLALSLALHAGLRRGEIAGLQWGDVDLGAGLLRIRRQRQRANGVLITTTPKSAAGLRDVPISADLLPLLRSGFRFAPRAPVIDLAPETICRHWAAIQRDDVLLSQHYRLHDLRHSYGSSLILQGCNLRVVQYLMGHSSLEVTMRVYSHCSADQAMREVKRIASLTACR